MSTTGEQGQQSSSHSNSSSLSPSNSISLVKLDELSSFGATKQQRLPALIKLNPLADQQQQQLEAANSMPDFSGSQAEKMAPNGSKQQAAAESLPAALSGGVANKENNGAPGSLRSSKANSLAGDEDFQVVNMDEEEEAAATVVKAVASAANENSSAGGPSLPAPAGAATSKSIGESLLRGLEADSLSAQLLSTNLATGQYASHLGDSLIEMIINLRNENQNLVRALETNNEYVKERLSEFKKCQEEAKRREAAHAREKAEFEHQARKLKRQNEVLSERLRSLEAKLTEMNLEVGQSLEAAHSSKASSVRGDLYPQLADEESFGNAALNASGQMTTMQMDATSGELYNQGDQQQQATLAGDAQMDTSGATNAPAETSAKLTEGMRVGQMSAEELGKRFDADKSAFYALDDPMKQCDQLEQQLNDIGRRDYEICLLQQQLNIYRQDFRLERMAKLEARIQIEKLKNDIDRLCLDRLQEQRAGASSQEQATANHNGRFAAPDQSGNLIGKLGHHLGRKAVKSAAKAAKYAAKQAHLEEKAAAALARAAAAKAAAANHFAPTPQTAATSTTTTTNDLSGGQQAAGATASAGESGPGHYGHHHRGHRRHHRSSSNGGARPAGIRSEVMNDLLSTANKAMLTGYKMASTHVNLALDKLSQYEQQQASQLDPNNRTPIQKANVATAPGAAGPSAPPMDPPSID